MAAARQAVPGIEQEVLPPLRLKLAHFKRAVTPREAQAELEKGLANIYDFDEAVAWLDAHPEVANSLCPASLLCDFASVRIGG